MMALATGLMVVAAQAAHLPPVPPNSESTVVARILTVSHEPRAASGIGASYVRVTARAGAEVGEYFIPFLRPGQPHPAVGATCTITYYRPIIEGAFGPNGEIIRSDPILTSYRCGRDALVMTGR